MHFALAPALHVEPVYRSNVHEMLAVLACVG